jgi:hypothetical protein
MPEATLTVHVQPRAKRPGLVSVTEGVVRLRVASPPSEGKANAEVVRTLAELLGVPKSAVLIVRGASARNKTVGVRGLTTEEALAKLDEAARGGQGRLEV